VYNNHSSLASFLIPEGLLLTGWMLMLFLARRNERKVRSDWEALLRRSGLGWTPENYEYLPPQVPS